MGKLKDRFDALPTAKRFAVVFCICLVICVPAIPIAVHSDRRILQDLSDIQFTFFALGLCIGYAALLAVAGLVGEIVLNKRKKNHESNKAPEATR